MKTHKEEPKFSARQDKSYDRVAHEKELAEAAPAAQPGPPPANTILRDGQQIVIDNPVPAGQATGGSAIEQGNRNAPVPAENLVENPMDKARVEAFNKGKEDRVHHAEAELENARR